MSITARVFFGFSILFAAGLLYIFDAIVNDIRPRYFEAVEESMNDTVNIMASLIESDLTSPEINSERLRTTLDRAYLRTLNAKIFEHEKTKVSAFFYICNSSGIVIYDSNNSSRVGRDFSKWNDVYRTLRGEYGARSSSFNSNVEGLLYVSAPIHFKDKITGSITIEKPKDSVSSFIYLARRKIIMLGIISFLLLTAISLFLSIWITRPIKRLTRYVKELTKNKRAVMPKFSASETKDLANAFDSLWNELKGKRFIEEYIQKLTHELKSPLSSIRGSGELLLEDIPEDKRRDFTRAILRESKRIESIIEKMLLLSSLEQRDVLTDIKSVDIKTLTDEIVTALEPIIMQRNVRVEKDIPENLSVECEEFLIRHSLLNLIDNALRFSANSSVHISAESDGTNAILSIRDNGSGIPEFAKTHLFEKFYSVPPPGSKEKGTGLGLNFVREACALHKGSVSLKNAEGGGVVAKIIIPLKQ
jgi:two-component system, OmpR family, sensor histidine kinase CreC